VRLNRIRDERIHKLIKLCCGKVPADVARNTKAILPILAEMSLFAQSLSHRSIATLSLIDWAGGVAISAERLRERQEAAGNGLINQNERGGCLLFARRNGSAK
jgi:hypothetical protein